MLGAPWCAITYHGRGNVIHAATVESIGDATARIAGSFVKAKSRVTVKIEAISGDRAGAPFEVKA